MNTSKLDADTMTGTDLLYAVVKEMRDKDTYVVKVRVPVRDGRAGFLFVCMYDPESKEL